MTIRRRLGFSFLAILVLMAANQAMYLWSAQLRTTTLTALGGALRRQVIIGSLHQDLDNLHKEVTLLSQVEENVGADPEAKRAFNDKLNNVGQRVRQLQVLSDPSDERVRDLDQTYGRLADAWRSFYDYLGTEQVLALAQLVRADPLSQRLLTDTMPRLQSEEQARVQAAEENSARVTSLTDRASLTLFALSTLIAVGVAYLVSRQLVRGLAELKRGAAHIGGMTLEHRIQTHAADEIGDLGRAFNDMADKLQSARGDLTAANRELEQRNAEIGRQREVSESLLLNILPSQIAAELKANGKVAPRYYEDVTILFTDFVGFTLSTETLAAEDLVEVLHDYFTAFDQISARYGLEKLKTIGDSYLCVGGLPMRTPSHPVDAILAAFEIVQAVVERDRPDSRAHWAVRVGLHTGPVVAGIVGIEKFAFDIWGDSVNYASRMESGSAANQINLSAATYLRVKDFFVCEHRGKVLTKEKREVDMYFVRGLLPALMGDGTQSVPPAFLRRYHGYFQKDPPAFPAFVLETATSRATPVARFSRQ